MKIGLGTAAAGRPEYINLRQEEKPPFDLESFKSSGIELLELAYQKGVRYYDTAPGYGLAEDLLINWSKSKKDIEIGTKWGYTYVANFNPDAIQHEIKEHSLDKLNEQWAKSKTLLPQLSTYQIHSATLETGVLENEAVLERLFELKKEHGLQIGISTTGANQLEVLKKAIEIEKQGLPLFTAFQVTFNILDQSLLEILPKISASGKRIIVKEAMANGRLVPNETFSHYAGLYTTLESIAKKHKVNADAVALRFAEDKLNPFAVLSGGSVCEHITSNLKAYDFKLDAEDLEELCAYAISPEVYWKERKELDWQ